MELSQNDLVNLIAKNDSKFSGLDVVTISRWENDVVIPTHRKQVELFLAAGYSLFDYVEKNSDLLNLSFTHHNIKESYVWENSDSLEISNVIYKVIDSGDGEGNKTFCVLYSDKAGIPVGQLTYNIMSEQQYWKLLGRRSVDTEEISVKGPPCMVINSIFCLSDQIIIHMLGFIVKKLLHGEIEYIGYFSNNKKSNIKRFLKSIGFKTYDDKGTFSSYVLSYFDAIYNRELFHCAAISEQKGVANVNVNNS